MPRPDGQPGLTDSFKPFDQMAPEDYAAIGLRCGLEVHQQLLTRTKLFCRCPAGRYSSAYDAEILRHMRPTLSEFGEYDGTALMEKKTRKNIHYRIHHDTVCTYEFDDTPPFFVADEALDTAVELALLLRLTMVDELHIARKQYLDGSIPAGFQRTTILGVDGWIPYQARRIGIRQLGLEEDSCREVSDVGHERVYLTDRLGVPLIEVVTEADMGTPQEAAAVARVIHKLCRSTGKVRTGYGSVRQDVNVSVAGGTRVEIKGVPQISRMPRLIYNEARRQCSLLAIREELLRRGITRDSNVCRRADVSRIVAKSRYAPIRTCLADGGRVKCVLLEGFAGLLNAVTQEHTAFAKEFSDRIRVIACLTVLPNMVHSDDASESLYCQDWQRLFKKMEASHRDALILTWGNEEDTETACREIGIRAQEATVGIPSDTRQALKDGTNGFERVLPGAERMYPDTDLPPIAIPAERRERIRAGLPDYFWDREDEYRKLGLPEDVIDALSISPRAELFAQLVKELAVPPTLAGVVLCQQMKALRREGLDVDGLDNGVVLDVFREHANGGLAREGLLKILRYLLAAANLRDAAKPSVKQALIALCLRPVSDEEVTRRIRRCLLEAEGRHFPTMVQMHRSLMGVLMKDLRGCFEGARLASLLEKSLERTPVLNSTARA